MVGCWLDCSDLERVMGLQTLMITRRSEGIQDGGRS